MQTMSDCPFKSPAELGLTQAERDALIKALLLMENGQVKHVPGSNFNTYNAAQDKMPFNMAHWHREYDCGTVCCIGGTAELVGGLPLNSLAEKASKLVLYGDSNLHTMFFHWNGGDPTEKRAARVLRGYLTTGQTRW